MLAISRHLHDCLSERPFFKGNFFIVILIMAMAAYDPVPTMALGDKVQPETMSVDSVDDGPGAGPGPGPGHGLGLGY